MTNPVLSAEEARALGIINRVVADDQLEDAALAWATELASGASKALAAAKRLLWSGLG